MNWKLKEKIPENLSSFYEGYHDLLAQMLYNRRLQQKTEQEEFLNPKYEGLHSPFLFKGMKKAVDRIWSAIENNQRVTIYGDYDADAITANALLRQVFKYLEYQNVDSYIPDRFTEGYGVNVDALSKIKNQGTKLIITVDCGTNSVDAADYCAENGIDLIITDHHELIGEAPKAQAFVNPKNPEDSYPDKNITGVGVAFKMAQAILNRAKGQGPRTKIVDGWEKWLLDLVAIGTVADCHSLIGENRILVKYGLKVLSKTKWTGLWALCQTSGLDFKKQLPDTYTLGFIVAPRINAAGRLEHASVALDLLLEKDYDYANNKALELEKINKKRQELTLRVVSEAKEKAEVMRDRKIIVLAGKDWPKGVVGLVAGRLAQDLYKPAVILEEQEEELTGSARTAGDFNILEGIKYAKEHLVKFGGHKQAAGLTLKREELKNFHLKLLEFAEKNLEEKERELELEAEILERDLNLEAYKLLLSLEPFGVGNPRPTFLIRNIKTFSKRLVGNENKHLQINFSLPSGGQISAIWFNAPEFAKKLDLGNAVNVAAELLEDSWNGNKKLKLKIRDLQAL